MLEHKFPVHEDARMLRIGLDFFNFTLRRDERPEVWFQRFDSMLEDANRMAGLGLNVTFPSWTLLSLLQLTPRKWSDLLKELGHRLPREQHEYVQLQRDILRERILENSVFEFRGGGGRRNAPGSRHYFIDAEVAPRPLYMCLGDPRGSEHPSGVGPASSTGIGSPLADQVDVYDGQWLLDDGGDAGIECSIDTEQLDYENQRDLISPEEMRELQASDPDRVASLYWIARKAVRRYRAATGRFMPRRRAKGG